MGTQMEVRLRTDPGSTDHNRADVQIRDDRHVGLRIELSYEIGSMDSRARLTSVRVETRHSPDADLEETERLAPGVLRDLPYARWDRMAQGAVVRSLGNYRRRLHQQLSFLGETAVAGGEDREEIGSTKSITDPEERRRRAEETVRRHYPDLDPEANKFSTRTWNSLVRYADVSSEHLELLTSGVADPVGALAQRYEVAPATVRSWLHRAREAGVSSEMPSQPALFAPSSRPPARRSRYQEHVLQIQLKDAFRLMAAGRAKSLKSELKAIHSRLGHASAAEELRGKELVREIRRLQDEEAVLRGQVMTHIEELAATRKRASAVTRARVYIPRWVLRELESYES